MEILISIGLFIKAFIFIMSLLYCLKVCYDIVKVLTLQEGKVELGQYGLLYLGLAVSYVITFIFY